MDIMMSEREKRILELGVSLFKKKFKKYISEESLNKYLYSSKNKDFVSFIESIDSVGELTKTKYQRERISYYTKLVIWVCLNHPELRVALRDSLKKYTGYKDIDLGLEPEVGRFDGFIIEHAIKFIVKKLSEHDTYKKTLMESYTTANSVAIYVMSSIDEALVGVRNDFLSKAIRSFTWLGVYIAIHDTAYRDQFYYLLNNIGNSDLKEITKYSVKKPENWYINLYKEGRSNTHEKWKKGELPMHMNDLLEEPCLPVKQQQKIKKILERIGGAN